MRKHRFWLSLSGLLAGLSLALSACGPTPTEVLSPLSTPTAEESSLAPQVAALVEQAKQDLRERFGVAGDEIELRSVEEVQWRDSSLGCPQPGMNYLMVITPGYLIKLEANGEVYEYHASEKRAVYCANPASPPPSGAPPGADAQERLVEAAIGDLSQRLGIAPDRIQVVKVEAVQWPDASLGCPQPDKMYAQVITPGYQITLAVEDQEYMYHTDLHKVLFCQQ